MPQLMKALKNSQMFTHLFVERIDSVKFMQGILNTFYMIKQKFERQTEREKMREILKLQKFCCSSLTFY